jgi:hypothetical protein
VLIILKKGFDVHIDAGNVNEVTPQAIMKKVKEVCGKKVEATAAVPESVSKLNNNVELTIKYFQIRLL